MADRARFGAWVAFVLVWTPAVYVPVAHWVFGAGGWVVSRLHALDFAGGTVVGAYAFTVTYGIAKVIDRLVGFRAGEEEERTGLDLTVHAETAYDHGVLTHGMSGGAAQGSAAARLAASAAEDRSPLR